MAETEYTRRDIESVAEKEWGRIDIVEAGGGGSGDFEYCTVTVQSTASGDAIRLSIPFVVDGEGDEGTYAKILVAQSVTRVFKVPLYKGHAFCVFDSVQSIDVTTSGSITFDGQNFIEITGDGTITFTSGSPK